MKICRPRLYICDSSSMHKYGILDDVMEMSNKV